MYRLTLDDPRLALPVAVYRVRNANGPAGFMLREQVESTTTWDHVEKVAWFARLASSNQPGLISVYATGPEGSTLSTERLGSDACVLFQGLPLVSGEPETRIGGLWDCRARSSDGGEPLTFSLQLAQDGKMVRIGKPGDGITGAGSIDAGKLSLILTNGQRSFALEARVTGRTLEGQWQENGASTKGTGRLRYRTQHP
jgi:hypothetical protein